MNQDRQTVVAMDYASFTARPPVAGLLDHQVAQVICAFPFVLVVLPCILAMVVVIVLIVRG